MELNVLSKYKNEYVIVRGEANGENWQTACSTSWLVNIETGASSMASMKKAVGESVPPTHTMHACSLKSLFLKKDIVSVEIATSSHL